MHDTVSDLLMLPVVLVFLGYLVRSYWRLWKRIGVKALWSFVPGTMPYYLAGALVTFLIAGLVSGTLFGLVGPWLILILWPVLFFLWKYWDSRRASKTENNSLRSHSSGNDLYSSRQPSHLATSSTRTLRKVATGVGIFFFGYVVIVLVVLGYSFSQAETERRKIHVGMTAEEVLPALRNYHMLAADSDAPTSGPHDFSHSVSLTIDSNGLFHCQLRCVGKPPVLSAETAAELMHEKLSDGYEWHWHYTFVNLTPQRISFNVIFGSDGRVKEVQAPYGWD